MTDANARFEVVEGVNNMGFLERSDVYNAAIARFIDGLPDTRPVPLGDAGPPVRTSAA